MVGAAGGDRAALPEIWPPGSSADEAFDDAADLLHAAVVRAVGPGDGRRLVRDRVDALYYHTDHLGTPRELTNTDGHIVWEARYKAWGGTQRIEYPPVLHTFADGNTVRQYWIEPLRHERPVQNLRFQGQYYDEETGLHYNRFRYYDPDIGRFVSQDPIGLAGGINTYQYAPNPVTWIDPLGLNKGCKCATDGVPERGYHEEVYANKPVKPQDATDRWDEFLGPGPHSNRHPRTGEIDSDRIVSSDGKRSIRYGSHEMNSSPTKHHYHEETWTYNPTNNTMNVDNTVVRVPLSNN